MEIAPLKLQRLCGKFKIKISLYCAIEFIISYCHHFAVLFPFFQRVHTLLPKKPQGTSDPCVSLDLIKTLSVCQLILDDFICCSLYTCLKRLQKRVQSTVRDIGYDALIKWFKDGLTKWRLAFLAFVVTYCLFLVFGIFQIFSITHMSIQWDEVTNLNGGLLLLRGNLQQFLSWNTFYPPMYDVFTAGFFAAGGVSIFIGRFVSIVFSLLSLYAVFEFTSRMYGAKTALLASILLAVMPGYILLSRMAMIETTLMFFFTVSTLSFFFWLKEHKNSFLALSNYRRLF